MIDSILMNISNSKLFGGCIMLLTNIGGKYLVLEMPTSIDKLFANYFILRYLVLFSVFFMATRDIKISILLSLLFFIILKFILNENSSFCLVNKNSELLKKKITTEEYNKAKEIINKYNNEIR